MARPIRATEKDIRDFLETITSSLKKEKIIEKSVSFSMSMQKDDRKATIIFSQKAWIKMFGLIDGFDKEVQWHGDVSRFGEDMFLVEDIITFPHTASSATVESDQEEYEKWQDGFTDEEFEKIKLHGHSHVNMDVSPSVVDMKYRSDVINNFFEPQEGEDQFYIFLIFNKRRQFSGQIFDLKNNALYNSDEIFIDVLMDDHSLLTSFVADTKKIVKNPPIPTTTYQTKNGANPPQTQPPTAKGASTPNGKGFYPAQDGVDPRFKNGSTNGNNGKGTPIDKSKTYPKTPSVNEYDDYEDYPRHPWWID
jgi:hypothetical protein